jgi:hypothetical protein
MTLDDAEYVDQHSVTQQAAPFQHQNFVLMNVAAKEAYTVAPSPNQTNDFAKALNNVAAAAPSGTLPSLSPKGQTRRILHPRETEPYCEPHPQIWCESNWPH